MKRNLLLALGAVTLLCSPMQGFAQTPAENAQTLNVMRVNADEVLPTEDTDESINYFYHETFDKIGGSMDNPVAFDFGTSKSGNIDEESLTTTGFKVACTNTCKRAGSSILVTGEKAYLAISLGEMRGRHKKYDLYFKIKSETGEKSVFSILNTQTGMVTQSYYNAEVPGEWTWIKVPFEFGNPDTGIEFDNEVVDNGFYIDEILVVVSNTCLNGPIVQPATDIDATEFTAHWFYSYDAKGVYFDVFSYADEATTRAEKSETQNFADINVVDGKINKEDANMPSGWSYRFTKTMDKLAPATDNGYSIVLNKEIEHLTSPNYDEAPYTKLSFDLKAEEGATGKLIVEEKLPRQYTREDRWINDPYEWSRVGEIDLSQYTSAKQAVDLSSALSKRGVYVRFRVEGNNDKGAEISNVSYTYGGDLYKEKKFEVENLKLTSMEYVVSDLDPNTEYFYRLRTFDDNYISDYSVPVRGRGKVPSDEMTTPTVLAPDNITTSSFRAKWEQSIFTDSYVCQVYREYTASEDVKDFNIMSEDFSAIEAGTVENPVYGTIRSYSSAIEYNVLPGFTVDHGLTANGMFGIYNVFKDGAGWAYGHLTSPVYTMPDGYYTIKFTATAKPGAEFLISSYNDEEKDIQTSRKATFTKATEEFEFTFPASNYTFFEIGLQQGTYTMLMDNFEISMDLNQGDNVSAIVDEVHTIGAFYVFDTPYWTKNDKIYYQVKGTFIQPSDYSTLDFWTSDPSKKQYVDYTGVGINDTEATEAAIFMADGELNVRVAEEQPVTIYNMTGTPVARYTANEGLNTYSINGNGMFIVVVGNKTAKIVK